MSDRPTAVAILTFNRLHVLEPMLESLRKTGVLDRCEVAVFEDCGFRDGTRGWLAGKSEGTPARVIDATKYVRDDFTVFLGNHNLGVAGNSNRALYWFLTKMCDHLLLCNDDFVATGPFDLEYRQGHIDTEIGMFCFNDFEAQEYQGFVVPFRGRQVRVYQRMTGMMMSVTRALVTKIGYFDTSFKKFGEEHCDWTNRARFEGFVAMDRHAHQCLDLVTGMLQSQQGHESSVTGRERLQCDREAAKAMAKAGARYRNEAWYRPFSLRHIEFVGACEGAGIPMSACEGYAVVDGWAPANYLNE